jgi:hypothetical protein
VGFVVGQVFSEYFGFPCQSLFHEFLPQSPSPIIRGWYNRPVVAAVPKVPLHRFKKKRITVLARTRSSILQWAQVCCGNEELCPLNLIVHSTSVDGTCARKKEENVYDTILSSLRQKQLLENAEIPVYPGNMIGQHQVK